MERMLRPEAIVLGDNALIPPANRVSPEPNQFTHELTAAQPFYYSDPQEAGQPAGEFAAGTRVILFRYQGGKYCRVVDGQGLYVETEYAGLRRL
jgi:hypothetical protein